jgi:hypothetical protein
MIFPWKIISGYGRVSVPALMCAAGTIDRICATKFRMVVLEIQWNLEN